MKVFWCRVDHYRFIDKQRNTQGVYLISAKNEKEAKDLLQKTIKFGSIDVKGEITEKSFREKHREQFKQLFSSNEKNICFKYSYAEGFSPPHAATDDHESWDQNIFSQEPQQMSWYLSRKMRNHR